MSDLTPTTIFTIAAANEAVNEIHHETHSKKERADNRTRQEQIIHDSIEASRKTPINKNSRSPVLGKAPILIPPKQFSIKTGLAEASTVSEGGSGSTSEAVDSGSGMAGTVSLTEDPSLQETAAQPLLQSKALQEKNETAKLTPETSLTEEASATTSLKFFEDDSGLPKGSNIIAVLCYIMMVEVQVNSSYWSANFNIASQDMNMIATLAPTAAEAAKQVYDAQAQEEAHKATMERTVAIGQTVVAGMTAVSGVAGCMKASAETKDEATRLGVEESEGALKKDPSFKPKLDTEIKNEIVKNPTLDQQKTAIKDTLKSDPARLANFNRDMAAAEKADQRTLWNDSTSKQEEVAERYLTEGRNPLLTSKPYNDNLKNIEPTSEQKAAASNALKAKDPDYAKACQSSSQKAGKSFWEKPTAKALAEGFNKALQYSQMWSIIGNMTSSWSQAVWEGVISQDKTNQGNATATQKISEYFVQYKQTDYERQSQLTNQAQEFINTFLNSINSEVQEISQTSRAMFQSH